MLQRLERVIKGRDLLRRHRRRTTRRTSRMLRNTIHIGKSLRGISEGEQDLVSKEDLTWKLLEDGVDRDLDGGSGCPPTKDNTSQTRHRFWPHAVNCKRIQVMLLHRQLLGFVTVIVLLMVLSVIFAVILTNEASLLASEVDNIIMLEQRIPECSFTPMESVNKSATSKEEPYVSFVLVTRNDDHGVGAAGRLSNHIRCIATNAKRIRMHLEIVIVEWNYIAASAAVSVKVQVEQHEKHYNVPQYLDEHTTVKIVRVPNAVHNKLPNSDMPIQQWIGKNVGIDAATGRFVVLTNIDMLFNPAFFDMLATQPFRHDVYYRMARYDLDKKLPDNFDPALPTLDVFAMANLRGFETRPEVMRTLHDSRGRTARRYTDKYPVGGLYSASLAAELKTKVESHVVGHEHEDSNTIGMDDNRRVPMAEAEAQTQRLCNCSVHWMQPFTWACGDFTMVSREKLVELRGYPAMCAFTPYLDFVTVFVSLSLFVCV